MLAFFKALPLRLDSQMVLQFRIGLCHPEAEFTQYFQPAAEQNGVHPAP